MSVTPDCQRASLSIIKRRCSVNPFHELLIDREFKNLSPGLLQGRGESLENDIILHGCQQPILVWGNILIDGHVRHEICQKWNVPFATSDIRFESREDAIIWICRNHLSKDNLPETIRRYLMGKCSIAENSVLIREGRRNRKRIKNPRYYFFPVPDSKEPARFSCHTIYRHARTAGALDCIFQKEPELFGRILSGHVKISLENILLLAQLPREKIRSINRNLSDNCQNCIFYSRIQEELRTKNIPYRRFSEEHRSKSPRRPAGHTAGNLALSPSSQAKPAIKEMPAHDPDGEICSLTLTIPSWISTMERARRNTNLCIASRDARTQLHQQLNYLTCACQTLINALEEYK